LVLAVTAMTRSSVRVTTVCAVVVVAVIAAVVSYSHMQQLAASAGEDWRSWLIPLSIDGLVVAASMVLLTRRRNGLPGGRLAWGALGAGVLASLAANMADARPDVTAVLVAGWPAVAFAVAVELLLQQRRAERQAGDDEDDFAWIEAQGVRYEQEQWDELAADMGAANRERNQAKAKLNAATARAQGAETAASAQSRELARLGSELASERAARAAELTLRDAPSRTQEQAASEREEPSRAPMPASPELAGNDDLIERVRQLVTESTAAGRPMGRRAMAKQLDASEHRVRVALELVGATAGPVLNGTAAGSTTATSGRSAQ
jgi:hypothetical protein